MGGPEPFGLVLLSDGPLPPLTAERGDEEAGWPGLTIEHDACRP
jgi:hypothetical protein